MALKICINVDGLICKKFMQVQKDIYEESSQITEFNFK